MIPQKIYQAIIIFLLTLIAVLLGVLLYDALVYTPQELEEVIAADTVVEQESVAVPADTQQVAETDEIESSDSVYPSDSFLAFDSTLIGITFGNGTGVQIVDDAIVSLHSIGPKVYATRHADVDGEVSQDQEVIYSSDTWASPGSLSESENTLFASVITRDAFYGVFSFDGGITWTQPDEISSTPVGAAVPTSCLWHEGDELHAMFAWVAPAQQGDGGPLYVATYEEDAWSIEQVTDFPYASSPSLDCDATQQSMILRVEESLEKTGDIDVYFLQRVDGVWQEADYVMRGADPHLAVCGEDYWVGFHDVGAYRLHSSDQGETWTREVMSKTGKFGSIACDGDVVAISWGQWPSLAEANSRATTRGVGAQVSFDGGETWEEWLPAGDKTGQQISMLDVKDGVIVIFWRSSEGLHLKIFR